MTARTESILHRIVAAGAGAAAAVLICWLATAEVLFAAEEPVVASSKTVESAVKGGKDSKAVQNRPEGKVDASAKSDPILDRVKTPELPAGEEVAQAEPHAPLLKSTELFSQNAKNRENLDAAISGVPLRKVLAQLATVTEWKIFVEPGLNRIVNAKFKNLPRHEALPFLFGGLNYALVADGKNGQRLLVFRENKELATEFVRPDLSQPIPNELVVVLKKGSKLTPEEIAALINGKVVAVSKDGKSIRFRFESPEDVAKAKEILADLVGKEVDSLQNNYYMISPEAALNLAARGALGVPGKVTAAPGDATTIALIDSALHLEGAYYRDVVLDPINFTGETLALPSEPTHADSMIGSSVYFLDRSGYDSLDINYWPYVVIDSSGTGDTFSVSQAIVYAVEAGVDVINISLCGDVSTPYMEDAVRLAVSEGIPICASAGNEPTQQVTYPSGYEGVIAATALENGQLAPYANRGPQVDAAIAGTGIFFYEGSFYMTTGTSVSSVYLSTLLGLEISTGKTPAQATSAVLNKFGTTTTGAK